MCSCGRVLHALDCLEIFLYMYVYLQRNHTHAHTHAVYVWLLEMRATNGICNKNDAPQTVLGIGKHGNDGSQQAKRRKCKVNAVVFVFFSFFFNDYNVDYCVGTV